MKKLITLFLVLLMAGVQLSFSKEKGWINLFNGKDLTGWKQLNGQAKYEVKNGEIIGTTVMNTPNSFLCTEKMYSDFIFEVDLFLEGKMNSGIQFRSESKPEYNNGRVHGYQCEVDPSERAWSGGIYDEARRGWLYTGELNLAAKNAFKNNDWNHYRIECIGSSIKTWLNGIAIAHVIDNMTPAGFIALQVHSIGNKKESEGLKVRWKNIRIKTTGLTPSASEGIYVVNLIANNISKEEKEQGYELLFDGTSTSNWKSTKSEDFPKKSWQVLNGELVVNGEGIEKGGGDIITRKQFGPFELKFDFKIAEGANSGIKYGIGNNGPGLGLEYQILDDDKHPDAKMGVVGNRTLASLYDLIPAEKEARFVNKPGEWNQGRIVSMEDGTVQHWLNGRKVVEFNRGGAIYRALVARSKYADLKDFGMAKKGPILLQEHGDKVHFRSIKIKEIK
jgi:hypothetical protein